MMLKMAHKSLIAYAFFWCLFLAQCVTVFYCMINSSEQMKTLTTYGMGIWLVFLVLGAIILLLRSISIDRYTARLTAGKPLSDDDLVAALSRCQTQPMVATILYFILWNVVHVATYSCFKMLHIGNLAALSLLGGWFGGMVACPLMLFGVLSLLYVPINTLFYDEIHKRSVAFKGIGMTIKFKLMAGFVLFSLGLVIWLGSAAFYTGVIQMVEEIKSSNMAYLQVLAETIPVKGGQLAPQQVAQFVADRNNNGDTFFCADGDGNILWASDQTPVYVDRWADINADIRNALKQGDVRSIYENVTENVITVCPVGPQYRLGMVSGVTKRMGRFGSFKYWFLFFVIVGLFVGYVIGYSFISEASRSIQTAASKLKELSENEGDLTKRLSMTGEDEVGHLILAFNGFMEKLRRMISAISGNSQSLSDSSTLLSQISSIMNEKSDQMNSQAGSVAGATEEVSVSMASITSAMEQTSVNTGLVAAAVEEMTATINNIADSTGKAFEITAEAVSQSNEANEKVDQLGVVAENIGKVTEVITEISEQTNLLALNATIEAARAGESGKGFAIVANEIKELSKQTAEATLEIKSQISHMQSSTTVSIEAIKRVAKVIAEVSDIVSGIASAVEEQSVTTSEIAENIIQTSLGIDEVKNNIVQVSTATQLISQDINGVNDGANEINHNSSQVASSAEALKALAGQLKDMVGKFTF